MSRQRDFYEEDSRSQSDRSSRGRRRSCRRRSRSRSPFRHDAWGSTFHDQNGFYDETENELERLREELQMSAARCDALESDSHMIRRQNFILIEEKNKAKDMLKKAEDKLEQSEHRVRDLEAATATVLRFLEEQVHLVKKMAESHDKHKFAVLNLEQQLRSENMAKEELQGKLDLIHKEKDGFSVLLAVNKHQVEVVEAELKLKAEEVASLQDKLKDADNRSSLALTENINLKNTIKEKSHFIGSERYRTVQLRKKDKELIEGLTAKLNEGTISAEIANVANSISKTLDDLVAKQNEQIQMLLQK